MNTATLKARAEQLIARQSDDDWRNAIDYRHELKRVTQLISAPSLKLSPNARRTMLRRLQVALELAPNPPEWWRGLWLPIALEMPDDESEALLKYRAKSSQLVTAAP